MSRRFKQGIDRSGMQSKRASYGSDYRKYRRYTAMGKARGREFVAFGQPNQRTGGFLGMENKFYDTVLANKVLTAPTDGSGAEIDPATHNCISAPAQGDGEQNRDGRKMVINNVFVNGMLRLVPSINATAIAAPVKVYVALVQDKQTNGAQLNSEDVFINPAGVDNTAASPLRNLEQSSRFRVLAIHECILNPLTASYDGTNIEIGGDNCSFKLSKKVNIPVMFTGATEGVSSVTDQSLHLIGYVSNVGFSVRIDYNSRIRFTG